MLEIAPWFPGVARDLLERHGLNHWQRRQHLRGDALQHFASRKRHPLDLRREVLRALPLEGQRGRDGNPYSTLRFILGLILGYAGHALAGPRLERSAIHGPQLVFELLDTHTRRVGDPCPIVFGRYSGRWKASEQPELAPRQATRQQGCFECGAFTQPRPDSGPFLQRAKRDAQPLAGVIAVAGKAQPAPAL